MTGSEEQTSTMDAKAPVRRRRRTRFKRVPRPVVAMRGLWESATAEQQGEAHQATVWMLEYWLGKISKAQAAQHLGVPQVRVWQMSQKAVAGMVCGLLPQPRWRKGQSVTTTDPENDPAALRKEVARLNKELAVAKQLIDILKTLPGNAGRQLPTTKQREKTPSRRGRSSGGPKPGARRSRGSRKKTRVPSATPPPGGKTRGATSGTGGSQARRGGGDGPSARQDDADGAPLEEGGAGAARETGPSAESS